MHKKKFSFSALLTVVILAVAVSISVTMKLAMEHFNQQVNAVAKKQVLYNHISDIDKKVRDIYTSLDEEQLQSALAEGYVQGIGDPYAKYYSTDEYKAAQLTRAGQAAGVGIVLKANDKGELTVGKVHTDSAAHKAGVKEGDVLASLNGESLVGTAQQVVQKQLDESTEKLTLSVKRDGKAMAFELTAYTYALDTVIDRMIGDTVGYIRITAFYDNTFSQFKAAYSALVDDGAQSFVFDVRGCAQGGSTAALEQILSNIMPHGTYATYTAADGTVTNMVSHSTMETSLPSVTLVNNETRGEAEVFAGVLQEFNRTTVIGEKTVGKGKVQDFVPLQVDNSAMLLTVGEIKLIRGGAIEDVGITPNTTVAMSAYKAARIGIIKDEEDDQLQAALQALGTNLSNNISVTVPATTATTANP